MERELNLPTCLFGGPPDPNDFLKLAESQLGFMNIFARPLFEGVADILPDMRFTLAELSTNRVIWQERIEAENSRKMSFGRSPMSRSATTLSDADLLDQRDRLSPRMLEHDSRLGSRSLQGGKDYPNKSNPSITMQPSDGSPSLTFDASGSPSMSDVLSQSSTNASPMFVYQGSPRLPNPDNLEVNDEQRRHSSVYSRKEDEDGGSRTGSVDPTTSTNNFQPPQPSPAAHEVLSYSQPPSPVKSAESTVSQSHAGRSLPSARSQATSNTEGGPASPSTRASSVEDSPDVDADLAPPSRLLPPEKPFIHGNRSEDFSFLKSDPSPEFMGRRKPQTMSVYGPDILAMAAAASPGKNSATSQITSSGGSDDGTLSFGDHNLRPSRSQNRLRGLRFWKKKNRPGEVDMDSLP